MHIVQKDNERLRNQLVELKIKRKQREREEKEITEPPKRELKKDHRLIPGTIQMYNITSNNTGNFQNCK